MSERERFGEEVKAAFKKLSAMPELLRDQARSTGPQFLRIARWNWWFNRLLVDFLNSRIQKGDETVVEVLWKLRLRNDTMKLARSQLIHSVPGSGSRTHLLALPPRLGEKFLYLLLPKEQREAIPGDLEEEFRTVILPRFGAKFARQWYWMQVFSSILPIIRIHLASLLKALYMVKLLEWVRRMSR